MRILLIALWLFASSALALDAGYRQQARLRRRRRENRSRRCAGRRGRSGGPGPAAGGCRRRAANLREHEARPHRQGRRSDGRRDRRQGFSAAGRRRGCDPEQPRAPRNRRRHGGAQADIAGPRDAAGGGQGIDRQRRRGDAAAHQEGARERKRRGHQAAARTDPGDPRTQVRDQGVAHRCRAHARPVEESDHQDAAAGHPGEIQGGHLHGARRRHPHRGAEEPEGAGRQARLGRARRRDLHQHFARFDPAAGRAGPRHHLRADGRDQHGARRAHHGGRLHHLRGAEPVQGHPVFRLVPAGGGAGFLRCRGGSGHGARAAGDPLAVRPTAGKPCSPPGASA